MEENKTEEKNTEKKSKGLAGRIFYMIGLFLLILIILFAGCLLVPRLFGIKEYAVVSGSMEPAIPVGSLVFVKETDPELIESGDVIAFYTGNSSVPVVHRAVENDITKKQIRTKGDANEQEDIFPVEYEKVIGKVSVHIPALGRIFMAAGR